MAKIEVVALLVVVWATTVVARPPFFNPYQRFYGGGYQQGRGGYIRPPNRQGYGPQPPSPIRGYNKFFRDDALLEDANYRPHGGLSFGGATGGDGVGISVGGGQRPQVSVGMGAVGGGVGAEVEGEGKYYHVKMMS